MSSVRGLKRPAAPTASAAPAPTTATTRYLNYALLACTLLIAVIVVIAALCKTTDLNAASTRIPEFRKSNVHFNPYPEKVDISNRYDCNAKSLHICQTDDPTTLFGCKELTVRCHHFDVDVTYKENNNETIIPKNRFPTEGYALAITTMAQSCNPYHGNLTLVALNNSSSSSSGSSSSGNGNSDAAADAHLVENHREYMLVCTCTNPGYIGNESLLGNCTSVYICNGRIDNIDQPLSAIECVCAVHERNVRYSDGLPVCKTMTVLEANNLGYDWSKIVPWTSNRLSDISIYNPTIRENMTASKLLDPCRNAVNDGSIEIVGGAYDSFYGSCRYIEEGIPLATGMLQHAETVAEDRAAVLRADCALSSGPYSSIRMSDNIASQRKLVALQVEGLPFDRRLKKTNVVVALQPGFGVGQKAQVHIIPQLGRIVSGRCEGRWPRYDCSMQQHFRAMINGLPSAKFNPCPGTFLYNQKPWMYCEKLGSRYVTNYVSGVVINQKMWLNVPKARPYGMIYESYKNKDRLTGVASFVSQRDYNIHAHVITS